MFGLPLVIYIFSPFFDYPILRHTSRMVLGSFGMIAGTWITLMGLILVVIGWRKIHGARDLVTDGIYKHIRLRCVVRSLFKSSRYNWHGCVAAKNCEPHGADDPENECRNEVRLRADLP